jgi:hypothetical protein
MSAFKHRGEDISVDEAPVFKEKDYTVDGKGKVVYKAGTRFGNSYSDGPQKAVDDAKRMIDRNLDGKSCLLEQSSGGVGFSDVGPRLDIIYNGADFNHTGLRLKKNV